MLSKDFSDSALSVSGAVSSYQHARVLLSVSDKTDLGALASGLRDLGCELIATSSTQQALAASGVSAGSVESLTEFPEILGGRVKTLHPRIFGGILARPTMASDVHDLQTQGLLPIAVVVCNLYPFAETAARGATEQELIEKIDIGGVSLLRAAAKNHEHVVVLCDPRDYAPVLAKMGRGELTLSDRRQLALKAFRVTAAYDALISEVFAQRLTDGDQEQQTLVLERVKELRYGENPHQRASLYRILVPAEARATEPRGQGPLPLLDLTQISQLGGKELSYNNYLDVEHGLRLLVELPPRACVIIKHNMPCGVGLASDASSGVPLSTPSGKGSGGESVSLSVSSSLTLEAFERAFAADPVSPFGGVVLFNERVDASAARRLGEIFLEIVVAPDFTPEARALLEQKKNLRLLVVDVRSCSLATTQWTQIQGGFLLQDADAVGPEALAEETLVYGPRWGEERPMRALNPEIRAALRLAWTTVKSVRSNAIVFANDKQTLAIAGGFTNRVDAVKRCIELYRTHVEQVKLSSREASLVVASDGFFPFKDSIDALAGLPIQAILQPGGSVRDQEVLQRSVELGYPMILSGKRHFKH